MALTLEQQAGFTGPPTAAGPVATGSPDAQPGSAQGLSGRTRNNISQYMGQGWTFQTQADGRVVAWNPTQSAHVVISSSGEDPDALQDLLGAEMARAGRTSFTHDGQPPAQGSAAAQGALSITGAPGAGGQPAPPTPGRAPMPGPSGGAGSGGNASGATGGAAVGSVGNPYGGGGGGGGGAPGAPPTNQQDFLDMQAGSGGDTGPTRLNMSDPLGMSFGSSQPQGGDPRFSNNGYFPNAPSITEGLGPDSTVGDAISNVISSQEASRNAALGIYAGVSRGQQDDPTLQGARGLAADLQANPFSLDDRTIQRIQGQQGDLIGRNAQRLSRLSADRSAAQGMGQSGMAERAQERIQTNAGRQLGDAQRGLLVEQATRRPQELAQAMQSTGQFGLSDYGQRAGIDLGAADQIHGQSSFMGDALVSGLLMGGGPPPINVTTGPSQGAFGSFQYAGPQGQMPYYAPG